MLVLLTSILFPSVLLLQLCRFIHYFLMSALVPHYRKSCKQRVPHYCLSKQASKLRCSVAARLCGANSFATEIVLIDLTDRQTLQ
jgi:hypothetical protein